MDERKWLFDLLNADEHEFSEKQVNILQAAIDMFAEKGYAATSTSEIAKRAGVAEGTIFRHYKTKKDLLLAIVKPTLFQSVAPFLAKKFVKDVFENEYEHYEQFVRAVFKNRYEFVKTYLPAIRVLWQEMAFHGDIKIQFQTIFINHVYDKFKQIVEHFQQKGELAPLPPETIIRLTITTIAGFLATRFLIMPDYSWDDEQEIERTIQCLMNGLKRT